MSDSKIAVEYACGFVLIACSLIGLLSLLPKRKDVPQDDGRDGVE